MINIPKEIIICICSQITYFWNEDPAIYNLYLTCKEFAWLEKFAFIKTGVTRCDLTISMHKINGRKHGITCLFIHKFDGIIFYENGQPIGDHIWNTGVCLYEINNNMYYFPDNCIHDDLCNCLTCNQLNILEKIVYDTYPIIKECSKGGDYCSKIFFVPIKEPFKFTINVEGLELGNAVLLDF